MVLQSCHFSGAANRNSFVYRILYRSHRLLESPSQAHGLPEVEHYISGGFPTPSIYYFPYPPTYNHRYPLASWYGSFSRHSPSGTSRRFPLYHACRQVKPRSAIVKSACIFHQDLSVPLVTRSRPYTLAQSLTRTLNLCN